MASQFSKSKKFSVVNRSFEELPKVERRMRMFIPGSDKRLRDDI
jgi:hypothetical protein